MMYTHAYIYIYIYIYDRFYKGQLVCIDVDEVDWGNPTDPTTIPLGGLKCLKGRIRKNYVCGQPGVVEGVYPMKVSVVPLAFRNISSLAAELAQVNGVGDRLGDNTIIGGSTIPQLYDLKNIRRASPLSDCELIMSGDVVYKTNKAKKQRRAIRKRQASMGGEEKKAALSSTPATPQTHTHTHSSVSVSSRTDEEAQASSANPSSSYPITVEVPASTPAAPPTHTPPVSDGKSLSKSQRYVSNVKLCGSAVCDIINVCVDMTSTNSTDVGSDKKNPNSPAQTHKMTPLTLSLLGPRLPWTTSASPRSLARTSHPRKPLRGRTRMRSGDSSRKPRRKESKRRAKIAGRASTNTHTHTHTRADPSTGERIRRSIAAPRRSRRRCLTRAST
jgi:hypothetical protein